MTAKLLLAFKLHLLNLVARTVSNSYYLTQIARRIVQVYDNDCNADMKTNGELLLLKLIVALRNDGVFFDVGANRGDWSAEVLSLNFEGRLVAVDPLPSNIENLKKRFPNAASCATLDSLAKDLNVKKIDFLKVDVEGHEYFVLSGANRCFQKV